MKKYYHGTSNTFEKPVADTYNDSNIFGQGLYTTDDLDTAMKYSRKGRGSTPSVLEVNPKTQVNAYDMHAPFDEHTIKMLEDVLPEDTHYLMDEHSNMFDLLNGFRADSRELGYPKGEAQEVMYSVRDALAARGHNAIEHTGGILTNGKPHKVTIFNEPHNDVSVERIKQAPSASYEGGYSEPVTKFSGWDGEIGSAHPTVVGPALLELGMFEGARHALSVPTAGEGSDQLPPDIQDQKNSLNELRRMKILQELGNRK